ncbi:DNA repair protein RecO [Caloramator mitchellensis]|uniref:DNA repair protein RecO n=1 Tax=Caloramator mitchellensis TaxID=908809 RepID=A0A0R3K142_CALMK|nr:DNA repair protein RecO [Caloramator mitchellensis]KRQ86645.1 DNA repair protein RecO [Caloramator mitchellensis]
MSLGNVQGVVLKSINLGESDKIITIFTDKLGKIDVVAHGARKPKSQIASSTLPFCYCKFSIYKGKNLYTLSQSQIIESFQRIIMDLEKLSLGSYILEMIDVLNEKEAKNVYMLGLLLKSLYLLSDSDVDLELLKTTFEYKIVSLSGYQPSVLNCVKCKSNEELHFFSITDGGMVCDKCFVNKGMVYELNNSELDLLRTLRNIKLEDLRNINYNKLNLKRLDEIMEKYISYYTEREFKSLNLIKEIKRS